MVTELIEKNDSRYFTSTSDKTYDQNNYKVFSKDGKSNDFDNYEDAQKFWFQWCRTDQMSHIEIVPKRKRSKGGFK